MNNFLTNEKRKELKAQHKKEQDRRVADRIKAIVLKNDGWTYRQIAEALMLDEETVSTHVQEYLERQKLKPENGGSESSLSSEQVVALAELLEETIYTKVADICFAVERLYGIKYTVSGMTNLLHRIGFAYKAPKGTPAKADPDKQKEFVAQYEKLKKQTPDNEPLLFIDSVHPTMATKVSYGWIKKGHDKLISTTASRTRVNIAGAIELKNMKLITQSFDTINSSNIIVFLKQVKSAYPDAPVIHLILDQSGYHRSKEVADFAEQNNVKLHFIPPYSPNLNSIERLWKVMNEYVRDNKFFTSAKEFRDSIWNFFNVTFSEISQSLKSRINDNFQKIKSASSS